MMPFHPGLRVRIATANFGPVLAEVLEVVLPDRMMKFRVATDPTATVGEIMQATVGEIMRRDGIAAALIMRAQGSPSTLVIEYLDDGRFREMHSHQFYMVELLPVEIKMEIQ